MDACIDWARCHIFPIHWSGAGLLATLLFAYARLVGRTARLVTAGAREWPDLPVPCVLALWHGGAPSLLCAIAKRKPSAPLAIMISDEPRGDCLALLCRLLGMRVVRGSSGREGWRALDELAVEIKRGACAILTPDGGGPVNVAKPGAAILAMATRVPLVVLGADCRPGLAEPHKWDAARNPLPFDRIAVAIPEPLQPPPFDPDTLDAFLPILQTQLESADALARSLLRRDRRAKTPSLHQTDSAANPKSLA